MKSRITRGQASPAIFIWLGFTNRHTIIVIWQSPSYGSLLPSNKKTGGHRYFGSTRVLSISNVFSIKPVRVIFSRYYSRTKILMQSKLQKLIQLLNSSFYPFFILNKTFAVTSRRERLPEKQYWTINADSFTIYLSRFVVILVNLYLYSYLLFASLYPVTFIYSCD